MVLVLVLVLVLSLLLLLFLVMMSSVSLSSLLRPDDPERKKDVRGCQPGHEGPSHPPPLWGGGQTPD